ncbi:MAG: xanthine dehydrogenase family protein molybdopterin-binding subunit [Stellaceae bacterium]
MTGAGVYAGDVSLPGATHLFFLRSPHAHARFVSLDASAARRLPGVVAIVTGEDLVKAGVKSIPMAPIFQRPDGSPATTPPRRALAFETVRFVGEAVAAIVAETYAEARDAADAVAVEYEELPAAVEMDQAVAADAQNIVAQMRHGDASAAEAAFKQAAHIVELELTNQRLAPTPMEPRSTIAFYDPEGDRITLRMSSQMPSGVRDSLCDEVLGLPHEKVRVLVGDVGGGFGMKTGIYPEDIVLAFCTRAVKRPVRWAAERIEEFLAATHGRDVQSRAALALDANGRVLAFRVNSRANIGAYGTTVGIIIQLMIGPWVSTSIYDIKTIDFTLQAVLTNTAPTGAYRGAGRPEAIYIIERLMDAAARKLGLEPTEIRRRNMIRPEQIPYTNPMGQTYDSGKFESVMNQALKLADWQGFDARAKASLRNGKLRGRGIATFLEWTGGNVLDERVTVAVRGDGEIEIYAATQAMGQGIATSYAQLAVDVFGVSIDKIRIVQGDTDRGSGFGSAGSRSLFTGGSAIRVASEKAMTTARDLASEELEAAAADIEYVEGVFQVSGTDHRVGLFELAARQPEQRIFIDSTTTVGGPTWPNGCHICEVEIDPDTGHVDIVDYASVNDVGRAVNPMIVRGQLDGGAVQGLGQAFTEHLIYERDSGQAQTASFMDYAMPRADLVHRFKTELDQSTPCLTNPLGVKGVGELGTIGATPAAVNAVADALARSGRAELADRLQMPLTAGRVWQLLHGSRK